MHFTMPITIIAKSASKIGTKSNSNMLTFSVYTKRISTKMYVRDHKVQNLIKRLQYDQNAPLALAILLLFSHIQGVSKICCLFFHPPCIYIDCANILIVLFILYFILLISLVTNLYRNTR